MLPQYHITDFPHYGRVFGELLGELTRLTAAGSEIAAAAIRQAETSAVLFFAILALGAVFGAAAIIMESVSIKAKGGKHYKKWTNRLKEKEQASSEVCSFDVRREWYV